MSNSVATKPKATVSTWLQDPNVKERLCTTIGSWMDGDAFIGQMLIAFQDHRLAECSQKSLFEAAHRMAALQLLPTYSHVALVPYKNKRFHANGGHVESRGPKKGQKFDWETACEVQLQYQGMAALVRRSSEIHDIAPQLVHKNDDYSMTNGHFEHYFDPFQDREFKSMDDVLGGYVTLKWTDRSFDDKIVFVTKREIQDAMNAAKTDAIWSKYFYQMLMKTLIRRAFTQGALPIDPMVEKQVRSAIEAEDRILGNDPIRTIESKPKANASEAITELMTAPLVQRHPEIESEPESKEIHKTNDKYDGTWPEWSDDIEYELENTDDLKKMSEIQSAFMGKDFDKFVVWRVGQRIAELAEFADAK